MASARYQVYGLEQTYPEQGSFFFKVVLSSRYYKHSHDVEVGMFDSAGKPIPYRAGHWGRKINIEFTINDETAEGVAHAFLRRGAQPIADIAFWVIQK